MPEDLKSLIKKNSDLEKRLKIAEAKIKVLGDALTSTKDLQKFIGVVRKEQDDLNKRHKRLDELSKKEGELIRKDHERETKIVQKQMDKLVKDTVKEAQFKAIEARLTTVEALVRAALAK